MNQETTSRMERARNIVRDAIDSNPAIDRKSLSLALGRNSSYIQQYLEKRSPKELPVRLIPKIAELLHIPLSDLIDIDLLHINNISNNGEGYKGFCEDAESYSGPATAPFAQSMKKAALASFKIRSSILDAIGIKPGDVRIFNMSPTAVENVKNGDVVVCQAYDKHELTAKTIVRQYLSPGRLVANSTLKDHLTIDMKREDVHIKGVMMTTDE